MNGLTILYEDEEIFVISKNSGLAVQGGANIKHSIDVDFAEEIGQKIFLVHRLDKDTAGLMIVAKNPAAAAKWTKLISGKTVKKEYIAICAGTIEPKKGIICEKIVQHGEEKKAVTNYEVEKEIETECGKLSQIRLLLETGRMHQIRIHLAKNSCPIAGDDQHGNFKLNKQLKKTLGIKKLLLASVKLTVPLQSKNQVFEIPLPEYMCF
ncbi:MAG: RluA family pseudouridine synthase [Treponema sp.]|nr:RluA family pseudouridine synthase [Treponema sp.]